MGRQLLSSMHYGAAAAVATAAVAAAAVAPAPIARASAPCAGASMDRSLHAGPHATARCSCHSVLLTTQRTLLGLEQCCGRHQCRRTMRGSNRDGPLTHHPAQAHTVRAAPHAPQVPDEEGGAQILQKRWVGMANSGVGVDWLACVGTSSAPLGCHTKKAAPRYCRQIGTEAGQQGRLSNAAACLPTPRPGQLLPCAAGCLAASVQRETRLQLKGRHPGSAPALPLWQWPPLPLPCLAAR